MDWTEAVCCNVRISRISLRATSAFLFFPSSVRRFGYSLRVSFLVGGMLGKSEWTQAPATWDWVPLWSFHLAAGLKSHFLFERWWYHYLLCHPSIIRTVETIGQHFYWPKWENRKQMTSWHAPFVKLKRSNPKSMDFCPKKMKKQCHGIDYALISLVHIISKAT